MQVSTSTQGSIRNDDVMNSIRETRRAIELLRFTLMEESKACQLNAEDHIVMNAHDIEPLEDEQLLIGLL